MKLYWLKIVFVFCVVTILLGFRSTNLSFPSYFPKPVYDFNSNQLSDKKIALGRMLFYDTRLSKNNSISCASCHSSYIFKATSVSLIIFYMCIELLTGVSVYSCTPGVSLIILYLCFTK